MLKGLKKKSSKWIKGLAPDYCPFYRRMNRAFSAGSGVVNIPGALPQAGNEAAPLALNRDRE
jgi:hypothetical protein